MRKLALILTFGGALLAGGCGDSPAPETAPEPTDITATPDPTLQPDAPATGQPTNGIPTLGDAPGQAVPQTPADLMVTINDGSGTADAVQTYQLTCAPPGGSHPRAEAACEQLNQIGPSVFADLPQDQMCTQVYGGPQTAQVTGDFGGQVTADFARTNGCEIDRWDSIDQLLGPADNGAVEN